MNGLIALVGSGNILPVMDEVDRFLLAHCRAEGRPRHVVCLPTAAGQEGQSSWGRLEPDGRAALLRLGADVSACPSSTGFQRMTFSMSRYWRRPTWSMFRAATLPTCSRR